MSRDGNYILWLPSWYPSRLDPLNGDFIQRHANAVSMHEHVKLIYVVKDESGILTKDYIEEEIVYGNLSERIIYYYVKPGKIKLLHKIFSWRKYILIHKKAVREIIAQNGKPRLVHNYIAMKAGIIATWIKQKFDIPFVVSEQWTGYLPEAKPNLTSYPFYMLYIWKKIFRHADGVSVVSAYLGRYIEEKFSITRPVIIPNVVNTDIFQPVTKPAHLIKRFVHVSLLNYQKNAFDIISAFSMVKKKEPGFILDIVGPYNKKLLETVDELNLKSQIIFHEETPQAGLALFIKNADALILYSKYETFGCVIIEANACGVPVIVSDIPVMHENVRENFNGLFARSEDPVSLAEKILWFMKNEDQFDRKKISSYAKETYNFSKIGKAFCSWYNEVTGT